MKNIPNWPAQPEIHNCLDCVHHQYEKNEEEVEVLVCFRYQRPIQEPELDAEDCYGYFTPNQDD